MVGQVQSYVVVGEEGGHTPLSGKPELSAGAAERRLKQQGRRGYIARLTGDAHTGTLEMVSALNNPEVPFGEVQVRFTERNKTRGSSNLLFRRV